MSQAMLITLTTESFEVSYRDAEHLWDHGTFSEARARPRVKESVLPAQGTTGSCDRTLTSPFFYVLTQRRPGDSLKDSRAVNQQAL